MGYIDFFSKLGFDPNVDFGSRTINIEENNVLTKKLKNSLYFYKSQNNTNTSFYLITSSLDEIEFELVRKYIWNKNDADIIFYYPTESDEITMLYAKFSPKISNKESVLNIFSTTEKDLKKLEAIKHWQFDSGAFWFNYHSFLKKAKFRGIDKELVSTLNTLKNKLIELLTSAIPNENERNETVQAFIDRTLYIKYLEDNHIINSYFYNYYFQDKTLNYKTLLENESKKEINELYNHIHEIFNNSLFDTPKINEEHLTKDVCNLIANSFKSDLETGQLRLFDFKFDILPVEFISYVYEIFLSEKQKANGIYYTPKKLTQLIVDDVIKEDKIGSILDPSCGSGMFLITGYQKLLEIAQKQGLEPQNSIEKIRFRTKLLTDNIFGVEKQLTAQRFTLFSLSLQIFSGINPTEIKEFIANELKENKRIDLFSEYSFFKNIKHANSLSTSNNPFGDRTFSYIVGNPPFFEIKNVEEFQEEISFLNSYQVAISDDVKRTAKDIIGRNQISQCFFLKIKDWSNENTRFGFVSNSSNFYNDYSETFQEYFYSNYGIEKIYELSRVKEILFEKAKESVVSIIFTNQRANDNIIDYYPVDLGLFSKKPFELLIIQEDKIIEIKQGELRSKDIRLRDYLAGNDYDRLLIGKLFYANLLEDLILEEDDLFLHRGIDIVGFDEIEKEFNISRTNWNLFSQKQKKDYYLAFKNLYSSPKQTNKFLFPFIKSNNINNFRIISHDSYLGEDISMFHRPRKRELYDGEKILISRIGIFLKAIYTDGFIYFDFDLYVLKLDNKEHYHLITAILNSNIINYITNVHLRKRLDSSFPKIGVKEIKNIPIPKELDHTLVNQISKISKELTDGKYYYSEKEEELNNLIFDLYELSYWEKQRVKDYFLPKVRINKKKKEIDLYKNTIKGILEFYFENSLKIEETSTDFSLIVVKISFNTNSDSPSVSKTKSFILNEIFEQNPNANFLASQEKIFGRDCVYMIKENFNTNWTETKAFEDAQDILKHLIPNADE